METVRSLQPITILGRLTSHLADSSITCREFRSRCGDQPGSKISPNHESRTLVAEANRAGE
jgi:hypothetical protein